MNKARRANTITSQSQLLLPKSPPRTEPHGILIFAMVGIVIMVVLTLWLQAELRRASEATRQDVLAMASATFQDVIEQTRFNTSAQVRVMADDARIRTTLATPGIDPATIEDVLKDMLQAGSMNHLALLDSQRKVIAIAGDDTLRGGDFGNSALFRDARGSTMWSSTDRLLAAAYAPVNLGFEQYSLLGTTALAQDRLNRLGERWNLSVALVLNGQRNADGLRHPEDGAVMDTLLQTGGPAPGRRSFRIDVLSDSPRIVQVVFLMPANRTDAFATMSLYLWSPFALVMLMSVIGVVVAFVNGKSEA